MLGPPHQMNFINMTKTTGNWTIIHNDPTTGIFLTQPHHKKMVVYCKISAKKWLLGANMA